MASVDDLREKYSAPETKANNGRSETPDWLQSPSRVFIHEHGYSMCLRYQFVAQSARQSAREG